MCSILGGGSVHGPPDQPVYPPGRPPLFISLHAVAADCGWVGPAAIPRRTIRQRCASSRVSTSSGTSGSPLDGGYGGAGYGDQSRSATAQLLGQIDWCTFVESTFSDHIATSPPRKRFASATVSEPTLLLPLPSGSSCHCGLAKRVLVQSDMAGCADISK